MASAVKSALFLRALEATTAALEPEDRQWFESRSSSANSAAEILASLRKQLEGTASGANRDKLQAAGSGTSTRTPSSKSLGAGSVHKHSTSSVGLLAQRVVSLYDPAAAATLALGGNVEESNEMTKFLADVLDKANQSLQETDSLLEKHPESSVVHESTLAVFIHVLEFWVKAGVEAEKARASTSKRKIRDSRERICEKAEGFLVILGQDMGRVRADAKAEQELSEKQGEVQKRISGMFAYPNDADLIDSYSKRHEFLKGRWEDQTCSWIHDNTQFKAWLDCTSPQMLWIHGPSGVGKSVMCQYIIDDVLRKRTPEGNTLWFYCTGDNHSQAFRTEIIKSIVYQIFRANRPTPEVASDPRRRQRCSAIIQIINSFNRDDFNNLEAEATMRKFERLFDAMAESPIFIVLDGLDEFPDDETLKTVNFLTRFRDMAAAPNASNPQGQRVAGRPPPYTPPKRVIKVLLLSRPVSHLVDRCEDSAQADFFREMDLPLPKVLEDVRRYMTTRMRQKMAKLLPELPTEELADEVSKYVQRLLPDATGAPLFLWVYYMCRELEGCNSLEAVNTLHRHDYFPGPDEYGNGLQGYYTGVLARMDSKLSNTFKSQIAATLSWVTYAASPLSLVQLGDVPGLGSANNIFNNIRRYLGSLVRLAFPSEEALKDPRNTLHLIHFSVAEYMRSTSMDDFLKLRAKLKVYDTMQDSPSAFIATASSAHARLFKGCLEYLQHEQFRSALAPIRGNATIPAEVSKNHPLFSYAATNWTYHLTRVTDNADAASCSEALGRFFQNANFKTWMEGSIAFYGGCEWLSTLIASVEKWFRDRGLVLCQPFENWVNDISDTKFEDFEQTLIYNNNEVHLLDESALLPQSSQGLDENLPQDVLHPLEQDTDSSNERRYLSCASLPRLQLARKMPEGEDGENRIGYISLDRNDEPQRGLLYIDLKCNHPRLVWERIFNNSSPEKVDRSTAIMNDAGPLKESRRVRLSSMIPLHRDVDHSQFTVLSATLSEDGSRLAALYREELTEKRIKLRVILWTFHHGGEEAEPDFLRRWKQSLDNQLSALETSLGPLYKAAETYEKYRLKMSRDARAAGEAKRNFERSLKGPVQDRQHDLARTLLQRPALPSTEALEEGRTWASAKELKECEFGPVPAAGPYGDSRYLLAFWDSHTLITPSGVFDIQNGLATKSFGASDRGDVVGEKFVLAPRGRFLLSTTAEALTVADLDPGQEPWVSPGRRRWEVSVFDPDLRIVGVIDCSESGHMASLLVEKESEGLMGVVVVDLGSLHYSLVFCHSTDRRMGIMRTMFCPRDNHLTVITQEMEDLKLEPRYSVWVANITRGTWSLLETTTMVPHALVYLQCNDAGCATSSETPWKKVEAESVSLSMSHVLHHRLRGLEYVQKPMARPLRFTTDQHHHPSADESATVRQDILHKAVDSRISSILRVSTLFSSISPPHEHDVLEKKTLVMAIPEDRTVHLLEFHNQPATTQVIKDDPTVVSICKPSWTTNDMSAVYMKFASAQSSDPAMHAVSVDLQWVHWELSIEDHSEALMNDPIKMKMDSFEAVSRHLLYRGLSLSRNLDMVAYWVGRHADFIRREGDCARVMPVKHQAGTEAAHSSLCCLGILFDPKDAYAAVLWCPSPGPETHTPRVRGTLLTLCRLENGVVDVRGSIEVDCDARGYHFHPTERLIAITCADRYLICRYGEDGFDVLRKIGEEDAQKWLLITDTPNGPASPPSTDETTEEVPITGLVPIHFSTCGTYIFSQQWNTFAFVSQVTVPSPTSPPSSRAVLSHFASLTTNQPHSAVWDIPETHPRIMHEDTLYAVGRHRLKIFRIRTYIVLGWSADANNLWIPDPTEPTWYRRVLCAIPQSISTWRAVLVWPEEGDDKLTVVLFPVGEQRKVRLPTVIYCPISWLSMIPDEDLVSKNNKEEHLDGWLRGHAYGCPYKLKA